MIEIPEAFIAVDKRFFHHNSPPIDCIELLRFTPTISHIVASRTCGLRDSEDMAGQEILRSSQVYEGGIGLSVFSGQEAFSSWNEEDMVVDRIALGR